MPPATVEPAGIPGLQTKRTQHEGETMLGPEQRSPAAGTRKARLPAGPSDRSKHPRITRHGPKFTNGYQGRGFQPRSSTEAFVLSTDGNLWHAFLNVHEAITPMIGA